jgi:hypothetical protein
MRAPLHEGPRTEQRRRSLVTKPIGYNELSVVADAIADVAPDWTVELSCTFPGDANIVIMPEGADDLIGPTFLVYQDRNSFHVDQFQWDILGAVGDYSCLRDAVLAVVACLEHLTATSSINSTLRH